MKKIIFLLFSFCLLFLAACSKTEQDPYKEFRSFSSSKIFNEGEKALAKKDYEKATKYFEALDALYPFGPYAEQGQLDIIYAYYMSGDNASAIVAADRFVRLYPHSTHVDYAYYMRGIVGFNLGLSWLQRKIGVDPATRDIGNLQQAYSAFAAVSQRFPGSRYAADATKKMAYIRNLIARREIQIAQFYMDRGAYVAATNRASDVVEHFEGSPYMKEALIIMVKGYRKLGLTDMARKSYTILQKNFPGTNV